MNVAVHKESHIKKIVKTLLPPPGSLYFSETSIYMSKGYARYMLFDRSAKHLSAKSWAEAMVPSLIGKEDIGKEEGIEDMIKILTGFREKTKSDNMIAVIPEESVYVFRIKLPKLSSMKEIRGAIELQLEENVPLSINDAVFEFDEIASTENDSTYSVSVISKQYVEENLELYKRAGFLVVGADTEGRALARVLTKNDHEPVLIVSTKVGCTTFLISNNGKVLFSSTIPTGRDSIIKSISKSLNISYEEASKMREGKLSENYGDNKDFFECIAGTISSLIDEINKIVTYWQTHGVEKEGWQPISHILVSGKDVLLPGFFSYLESSIKMPITVADPWANIFPVKENLPKITKEESLDYTPLIGAIL